VDPLGLWGWNPISDAERAAGDIHHDADDVGHFLKDPNRWRAEADYLAGVGNAVVSTVTLGHVHIAAPYCGYGIASDIGNAVGLVALTLLSGGAGEAADVATGAKTVEEVEAEGQSADHLADTEQVTSILQGHVDNAVAQYESGEIGMSEAQAARKVTNPRLEPAFRGQVIDAAAKQAILSDPALEGLYVTRSGEFGPDISDPISDRWWDITTPGQWGAHVARYSDPFGSGIPLFTGAG
jgi:hypothetical protein